MLFSLVAQLNTFWANSMNGECFSDALSNSLMDSNMSLTENNRRARNQSMLLRSQYFGGRGACWSFKMGLGRVTSINYSHGPAQN